MTYRSRISAALVFGTVLLTALAARAQSTTITFLLVNDIYLMNEQVHPDGKARGGFARLAAVVKAERAKGGHVVFANAGDTLSPSLMSGLDQGAHIIALTNLVPPDVFVPGNHEFDFGKAVFFRRVAEARFPIYAANLRGPDGQPLPGIKDRAVLSFDGVRVGVTGLAYDATPTTASSEDLRFAPTVATGKEQAAALRREGADIVVAVAHADRTQDLALGANAGIDLVLSGHDHDLFISYDGRNAITESGYDAHYVTAVDVTIQVKAENGQRSVVWWPQFRVIDTATVTPDPQVAAAVAEFEAQLSREMDVALGTTAVELDSRNATVRAGEAAIGNLFADAMREANRADAAVTNGGGIRAGKVYAPGSAITRRDILAELPFSNKVITVEMSGRDLRRALENGFAQLPVIGGRFPQVSNMTMVVDPNRPPGRRITAITLGGAPLSDTRRYKVAINDFMARGGDDYTVFRDAKRITPDNDAPLLANAVMALVRRLGTVRNQVEGRIVLR
jgi:2',3'-cyclic-nucleotide 2'-phosphodiesterase (5'-nucleotidase family)